MNQPALFDHIVHRDSQSRNLDDSLDMKTFDKRRRSFETDDAYHHRLEMIAEAFRTDYYTSKWVPITAWAEICPKGPGNRVPRSKDQLGDRPCFYLTMHDVVPEDWRVPTVLTRQLANALPARATYIARSGDVLLSRFKEPLGKCVVYLDQPIPTYVSSNFVLLRPKSDIDPILLLAVLKSSFLACQLHYVIRRRSLITEMFIKEVPQLGVPDLPKVTRDSLIAWGRKALAASATHGKLLDRELKNQGIDNAMSEAATAIDKIIWDFVRS